MNLPLLNNCVTGDILLFWTEWKKLYCGRLVGWDDKEITFVTSDGGEMKTMVAEDCVPFQMEYLFVIK